MKELFCSIVCEYPDYTNEYGELVDGTKCYKCKTFNELFEVLEKLIREQVLNHVHLEFCHKDCVNYSHGSIVLPLKNEDVQWFQNIVLK